MAASPAPATNGHADLNRRARASRPAARPRPRAARPPPPRRRTSCRTSARTWPRPAGPDRRRRTEPCRRSGPAGTARAAAADRSRPWAAALPAGREAGPQRRRPLPRWPPRRSPGRPESSLAAPRRRTASPQWRRRPRAGPPRPAARSGPLSRSRRNRVATRTARHRSPGGRRAAACGPPPRLVPARRPRGPGRWPRPRRARSPPPPRPRPGPAHHAAIRRPRPARRASSGPVPLRQASSS